MSAAAVILIRQNRAIRRFTKAGATSPKSALTPESLGVRNTWVFQCMVAHHVFVPVGNGRYYVDSEAARAFIARRWVRIIAFLLICGIIFLVIAAAGWLR